MFYSISDKLQEKYQTIPLITLSKVADEVKATNLSLIAKVDKSKVLGA